MTAFQLRTGGNLFRKRKSNSISKKTRHFHLSERGFLVFGMLGILVCVSMIFLWTDSQALILNERHFQNICRDHLLRLQEQHAHGIEKLLALNTPIRAAKLELKTLRAALAVAVAAGRAESVVFILKQIRMTELVLKSLKLQQQALIAHGQMETIRYLQQIRRDLKVPKDGPFQAQFLIPPAASWAVVSQEGPHSEYRLAPDFEEKQRIQIQWSWTWESRKGNLVKISQSRQGLGLRKSLICGATLSKSGKELKPRIHEGKSSLNSRIL